MMKTTNGSSVLAVNLSLGNRRPPLDGLRLGSPPRRSDEHELQSEPEGERRRRLPTKRYLLSRRRDVGGEHRDQQQDEADTREATGGGYQQPDCAQNLQNACGAYQQRRTGGHARG